MRSAARLCDVALHARPHGKLSLNYSVVRASLASAESRNYGVCHEAWQQQFALAKLFSMTPHDAGADINNLVHPRCPSFQTGWFPVNYVAISTRARPSVAPPPVPTPATSAAPRGTTPTSTLPANASQGLRMVSLGRGGAGSGVASRSSLPTSIPPVIGSRGAGGAGVGVAGGGSNGGLETVRAKFDYVAQVGESVCKHHLLRLHNCSRNRRRAPAAKRIQTTAGTVNESST